MSIAAFRMKCLTILYHYKYAEYNNKCLGYASYAMQLGLIE